MHAYATAVPMPTIAPPIVIGGTTPCGPHEEKTQLPILASTLQAAGIGYSEYFQWSLVHARPKFDPSCCHGGRHRRRPARPSGASRNRCGIRHFHGGYSADNGPPGS